MSPSFHFLLLKAQVRPFTTGHARELDDGSLPLRLCVYTARPATANDGGTI